ncbi:MAG TPA: DUF3224 domain-containing protein [Pyrinomonadaceae bacterium]|jgi:hypothetical protein
MTTRASGTFEVKLSPQVDGEEGGACLGRLLIDKRFGGDLEARSRGQMLAFRAAVEGSAGYVALEHVEGTLAGRAGGFVLQHSGTMERGAQALSVTVVPDSGTGELKGLAGRMQITVADGRHAYEFDYTLGDVP